MEHSESYTCVTSHESKPIYTHCSIRSESVQSPVRSYTNEQQLLDVALPTRSYANVPVFPVAHFLSACYLCKRELSHGMDIYMYRGDKAFCSMECRDQQILMDDGMALPTDIDK